MAGKKPKTIKLYCIEKCSLMVKGRMKKFNYGDSYEFNEREAESLLTRGRRKFVPYSDFKKHKSFIEEAITKAYDEAKKPRPVPKKEEK